MLERAGNGLNWPIISNQRGFDHKATISCVEKKRAKQKASEPKHSLIIWLWQIL